MLTKNDFSESDWSMLRETPHLVGAAMMLAGASGLGTVKESVALAQAITEQQGSNFPLLRDLSNRVEIQATQGSLRTLGKDMDPKRAPDEVAELALARVRDMLTLLSERATPEELDALRDWLYNIAERVANAAREGGFLGFGGTQVSEGEQAFLRRLAFTMGRGAGTS